MQLSVILLTVSKKINKTETFIFEKCTSIKMARTFWKMFSRLYKHVKISTSDVEAIRCVQCGIFYGNSRVWPKKNVGQTTDWVFFFNPFIIFIPVKSPRFISSCLNLKFGLLAS